MKQNIKEWIRAIVLAIVIAAILIQLVKPTVVSGVSMEPNFQDKEFLLVSKQSYTFGEWKRGDVVVFHSALKQDNGEEMLLIKRIIALPGERIMIKDGKTYINGQELEENYTKDGITSGQVDELTVPEGQVFCMGDNRLNSTDSRSAEVGCIDEEQIIGKVVFRLYPFSEFGKIGRLQ